jgi:hypothetical protein
MEIGLHENEHEESVSQWVTVTVTVGTGERTNVGGVELSCVRIGADD